MTYLLALLAILGLSLIILYYSGHLFLAFYLAYLTMLFSVGTCILLVIHFYRVSIKGNAPYIRTGKKLIERVLAEIDFQPGAKVYELGCGDGRFLRALAKQKNVQAIGYENFILPYFLSQVFNYFTGSKAKVVYGDFFKADLKDADYVFCYLIPKQMEQLEAKLKRELKPGALVISNTFKFENWPPEKQIVINEKNRYGLSNKIFIYKKVV